MIVITPNRVTSNCSYFRILTFIVLIFEYNDTRLYFTVSKKVTNDEFVGWKDEIKFKFENCWWMGFQLSFQRNGQTLDGNGTVPGIRIQADNKQVLMGYDSQLSTLINILNGTQ